MYLLFLCQPVMCLQSFIFLSGVRYSYFYQYYISQSSLFASYARDSLNYIYLTSWGSLEVRNIDRYCPGHSEWSKISKYRLSSEKGVGVGVGKCSFGPERELHWGSMKHYYKYIILPTRLFSNFVWTAPESAWLTLHLCHSFF